MSGVKKISALSAAKQQIKFTLSDVKFATITLLEYPSLVLKTDLEYSTRLSDKFGCKVYLKRQDLQNTKLFKIRGALYKITKFSEEQRAKGFVTASDGNFACVLAQLAGILKFKLTIFVPTVCQVFKLAQMNKKGMKYVTIKQIGLNFYQSLPHAQQYAAKQGCTFMHPFDDLDLIVGHSTMAHQISQSMKDEIDYIFVPSGGGALLASISAYFKQISDHTQIVCCEPLGAQVMKHSIQKGELEQVNPNRLCDGSSVARVGRIPFQICKKTVDQFVGVSLGQICSSIITLYKLGIVAEYSGALGIAALEKAKEMIKGKTVVVVISGGNTDLSRLEEAKQLSQFHKNLRKVVKVRFPNSQHVLKQFFQKCLTEEDKVFKIQFKKIFWHQFIDATLGLQSTSEDKMNNILNKITSCGWTFKQQS